MNRREPQVSLCERKFLLEAVKEGKRVDGREVYDYRNVNITLASEPGRVEVTLGKTRVLACVTCQVVQPRPQRPTEGVLFFNVELSPMASPSFDIGRQSNMAVEVTRILERCQKESRAVDTESLCIIAGVKVWEVRVDLHVLDHCGNIIDCAAIAAITALKHCRRPDVTVVGEEATVHPPSERDPVPLSVHHMPVCFTFAFYLDGEYMLVDPSLPEEQVMEGKLVVGMNVHREICVLQMMGGVAILPEQVMRCTQIAAVKCAEITEIIKSALAGKSTDPSEGFESILQSKRQEEEVDSQSAMEIRAELMQEDEPEKTEKVNYLGPGTAELVGLGGDSTWEVLDSIENFSDGDATDEPAKATSQSPRSGTTNGGRDSDSEEEDTVELVNPDSAITASDTAVPGQGEGDQQQALPAPTTREEDPCESGGGGDKVAGAVKKRGRRRGGRGGRGRGRGRGGGGMEGTEAAVRTKRKGQNKQL